MWGEGEGEGETASGQEGAATCRRDLLLFSFSLVRDSRVSSLEWAWNRTSSLECTRGVGPWNSLGHGNPPADPRGAASGNLPPGNRTPPGSSKS